MRWRISAAFFYASCVMAYLGYHHRKKRLEGLFKSWKKLNFEERKMVRESYIRFRNLTPAQKLRVLKKRQWFKNLPR